MLGLQFYGRPLWGPFSYEVAIVAGDPGDEGLERDDWKDVFARLTYTLFQNTDHEVTPGIFGYVGRSDIETNLGGIDLALRDDFQIVGADFEVDAGPINFSWMLYFSRHDEPNPDGIPIEFLAARAEIIWGITRDVMTSVRYEQVWSKDDPRLERAQIAPHLTYVIATNVLATVVWRQDIKRPKKGSSFVAVLDAVF